MRVEDWGQVEYAASADRQLTLTEAVAAGIEVERIVFCAHPAIVTLGRATTAGDVQDWAGETMHTARGGRATYHGPSQIVVYPILNLTKRGRDLHVLLRRIEAATVQALHKFGLPGARTFESGRGELSKTGVWIGERKVASIGIAVRKWVSYHGMALNFADDPSAFRGIQPCGFRPEVMTSVEREIGRPVDREVMKSLLSDEFLLQFSV